MYLKVTGVAGWVFIFFIKSGCACAEKSFFIWICFLQTVKKDEAQTFMKWSYSSYTSIGGVKQEMHALQRQSNKIGSKAPYPARILPFMQLKGL